MTGTACGGFQVSRQVRGAFEHCARDNVTIFMTT
jgi:hypothetical protein